MAKRVPQEDLMFPGEIFECEFCHQKNVYLIVVKPSGVIVWGGHLCDHNDKSKIGERIRWDEAEHFLNVEKREAESELHKCPNEKKEFIQQFISKTNLALQRITMR